jgi:hypothetical protein
MSNGKTSVRDTTSCTPNILDEMDLEEKGKKNMSLYCQQHNQTLLRPLCATEVRSHNLIPFTKHIVNVLNPNLHMSL